METIYLLENEIEKMNTPIDGGVLGLVYIIRGLKKTMELKDIRKWSFDARKTTDIPYFSLSYDGNPKVPYLYPVPLTSQSNWQMFTKPTYGWSAIPEYSMYVYSDKIEVRQRSYVGKTKVSICVTFQNL